MKIRIIKSGLPTYWYAGIIGDSFDIDDGPVRDTILNKLVYWPIGGKGCVDAEDCEVY